MRRETNTSFYFGVEIKTQFSNRIWQQMRKTMFYCRRLLTPVYVKTAEVIRTW